ncbi:hypothetical protein OG897_26995 [Streptomyces sp. NBC_00237]|uniref:hypothetical protein n=1 Tax=Streptomyces sp. NBC_00237 TaxID=2975687 RepID=UPI0022567354|nr:hypothetical protein [Streptomyces sp. NBC_00237]MCX5205090.1 hypothetical protein [Streptomyces sp. NBC_00237]
MPVRLNPPAPARPAGGWNRLSLNAHMWQEDDPQCALRPRSYPTFTESQNTFRARWGGFGDCIRPGGDCRSCPLLQAREVMPLNAPAVLVRVETVYVGDMFTTRPVDRLWLTLGPEDMSFHEREPWTWERLTRLEGWQVGARYRDAASPGLWLHRTAYAVAPHVEVHTRSWPSMTRHAFLVGGTRAALLTCSGRCRHDSGELLNAIGHFAPEEPDDGTLAVKVWRVPVPAGPRGRRRLVPGSDHVALAEDDRPIARLSFDGSRWSEQQIAGAWAALLEHTA